MNNWAFSDSAALWRIYQHTRVSPVSKECVCGWWWSRCYYSLDFTIRPCGQRRPGEKLQSILFPDLAALLGMALLNLGSQMWVPKSLWVMEDVGEDFRTQSNIWWSVMERCDCVPQQSTKEGVLKLSWCVCSHTAMKTDKTVLSPFRKLKGKIQKEQTKINHNYYLVAGLKWWLCTAAH